jgi:hypothetical protein
MRVLRILGIPAPPLLLAPLLASGRIGFYGIVEKVVFEAERSGA